MPRIEKPEDTVRIKRPEWPLCVKQKQIKSLKVFFQETVPEEDAALVQISDNYLPAGLL